MKKEMTKQDRALAIAAALEYLKPMRVKRDPDDNGRWVYFAEETDSWWSVSSDALVALGSTKLTKAAYEKWAEEDEDAVEIGRNL